MISRMEHNRYIGPTAKFKEFFGFLHQKLLAIRVNLLPCREYAEVSGSTKSSGPWNLDLGPTREDGIENTRLAAAHNSAGCSLLSLAQVLKPDCSPGGLAR
jgi:hypothetical protein